MLASKLIRQAKLESSKTLNIRSCGLKDFRKEILELELLEELILTDNQIQIIPDSICQLKNLKILDIRGNPIQDIPNFSNLRINYNSYIFLEKKLSIENIIGLRFLQEDISKIEECINFKNLQLLDLSDSQIKKLPISITNLPNLKKIDLSYCKNFAELSGEIGKLTSLEELNLSNSLIKKLPDSITGLSNLKKLNLSGCEKLRKLPNEIGNLISLEELDLSSLSIEELPVSIINLPNLKKINLSFCESLIKLPDEIGNLISLEELDLSSSSIKELPDSISKLTNLKKIDLSGCEKIKELPNEFGKLSSLEEINLNDSRIQKLPDSIINLHNLKKIDFCNCEKLKELPNEFGKLISLEELDVRNSSIEKLPDSITNLPSLKKISLCGCKELKELPDEFGKLIFLEELDVSNTNIQKLPDSIIKLTNLEKINLSECEKLKDLPNEFSNLPSLKEILLTKTRLKRLNLSTSKIQKLICDTDSFLTDYFETSYDIPNTTYLNIDETSIRKIHKITENSKCLEEFSCKGNGIRFLPDSILDLVSIKKLNLQNNIISYISPEICRFLDSRGIKLSEAFQGNPLEFPPSAVVDQGNEAVLDFLKKREDDAENLPQYRVIFAGEGGSGKSSLVDVLTGRGFDDTKETTKKINIVTESFEKENMTVHFWDFAGQENMHSAHRIFFTEDILYVIVLDSRKEEKPDEWLRFIDSKIGNKKAIIVLNKIDLNPHYDLDRNRLQVKYPFIVDFFKVSCQSDENMQEFKNALLKEIKKNYLEPPVKNWISVRKELSKQSKRQIYYDIFEDICEKQGISKERNLLYDYLHKIGFIFNTFNNRIVVLNTEWLIDGVYSIIASEKVIKENGRVQLEDYSDILNEEKRMSYSKNDFEDILKLMQDSELCFEESKGKYILPALLTKETPASIVTKRNIRDQLKIHIQYKNYLNSSILYQFIAKMHKSSVENLYWRTGIYIKGGKNNSAIIESDENLRRISISIHGENKREYFEKIILSEFEKIHNEYTIQFDILIDIPISDPSRTLEVNYEELKYLLETQGTEEGVYRSYQTKKAYYIDRIFEKSLSAQKGTPKELQEELNQILNKKFDELYLYMGSDDRKKYEDKVKEWLQISTLSNFENENQKRLISAERLLAISDKDDYSPYITQTCKIIEGELKWKFFINTFHNPNYKNIKAELDAKLNELSSLKDIVEKCKMHYSENNNGQKYKDLTIGSLNAAYIYYNDKVESIGELNTIDFFAPYRKFNIQDRGKHFFAISEKIRKGYRNAAAHSDYDSPSFSKEQAAEFRDIAKEWFSLWISGWTNNA